MARARLGWAVRRPGGRGNHHEEDEDEPGRLLGQAHSANVYRAHPAAVPTIGYAKPLADLTLDDVLRYHAKMYVPQNMIFVVAGDVDANAVVARCRQSLAALSKISASKYVLRLLFSVVCISATMSPNRTWKYDLRQSCSNVRVKRISAGFFEVISA